MTATQIKQLFRDTLTAQRTIAQEFIVLDEIVDFITQALTDTIPEWTALLTFQTDGTDAGKFCTWPDDDGKVRFWKTLVDDNINNEPPTNPGTTEDAFWIEVSPSDGSAIKEWAPGIYGSGLVIVFYNDDLYKLIEATRPFESVSIEDEIPDSWKKLTNRFWQGAWSWPAAAWPVAEEGGYQWYTDADLGAPGDAVFIAAGALLTAKFAGADEYDDYIIKP